MNADDLRAGQESGTRYGHAPLGRTQKLVLHLIAQHSQAPTIRDLSYDWPGLTESAARSAVDRLADRRLIDVAGFAAADNARTYKLTERGRAIELALVDPTSTHEED